MTTQMDDAIFDKWWKSPNGTAFPKDAFLEGLRIGREINQARIDTALADIDALVAELTNPDPPQLLAALSR